MTDLTGYYESTPLAAEAKRKQAAEQRLRAATEREVAAAEHAQDLREHADALHLANLQRVRLAFLQLQQRIGPGAPSGWLRFITEGLAACAAMAPPGTVAEVVRIRPVVGPRLHAVKPDGAA